MRNVRGWMFIFVLGTSMFAKGQKVVSQTKYKTVTTAKPIQQDWKLQMGWITPFGLHSGIFFNTEYIYKERIKEVNRLRLLRSAGLHPADRYRTKKMVRLVEPGLSVYSQKDFHTGVWLNMQGIYKWVRYKGFMYEAGMGAGYLRMIYPGPVYKVKSDGSIKEKSIGSTGYFTPFWMLGTGWDFDKWKHLHHNGSLHIRAVISLPTPMGTGYGLLSWFQVGYAFKLNAFTSIMPQWRRGK